MFTAQRLYIAAVYLCLAAAIVGLIVDGVAAPDWLATAVLLALAVLAQWHSTKWRDASTISVASIIVAASIGLLGPWGALIVGGVGLALSPVRWRLVVRLFNAGMSALASVVAAVAYLLVGGRLIDETPRAPLWLIFHGLIPLTFALVVLFGMNMALLSGMISLTTPATFWRILGQMVRGMWLHYVGYGLLGFATAVLWGSVGLGAATVILMATPLLVAQWSFRQMAAERKTQEATVATLVAALEARDPVLRGRGARVAATATAMGKAMGLRDDDIQALNFAGWLHDVGLASPQHAQSGMRTSPAGIRDLSQHATLSALDLGRLTSHPERGVRMVEGISFLDGSAVAIRHHHERWDGRGYPDRLSGSEIPLLARIVAVASTASAVAHQLDYDVERTTAELREYAGTQLDPECVEVLATMIEVVAAEPHGATANSGEFDHDLPAVSELMARAVDSSNAGAAR